MADNKPYCAFCGNAEDFHLQGYSRAIYLECGECGAHGPTRVFEEIVKEVEGMPMDMQGALVAGILAEKMTVMIVSDSLGCPYCGDSMVNYITHKYGRFIECTKCGTCGPVVTPDHSTSTEMALESWGARVRSDRCVFHPVYHPNVISLYPPSNVPSLDSEEDYTDAS
jgi:hypothetical protein